MQIAEGHLIDDIPAEAGIHVLSKRICIWGICEFIQMFFIGWIVLKSIPSSDGDMIDGEMIGNIFQ